MKRNLLLAIITFISLGLVAQEQIEVITGAGYANDVYYSLENGTVTTVQRDNWDIAFIAQVMSVSVLANNGSGVELYTYPTGDINEWANIDTTGMDWTPMYNSLETFDLGAFNANTVPGDDFDYGWGTYNMGTHMITGDSLFVIKTVAGSYKKIAIIQKDPMANTWHFKYANLDGSDEVIDTLEANNYIDKYFIHYSIDSTKWQVREPAMADWDLLFTKYIDFVPTAYSVTGVLINDHHVVAQEVRESGMDQSTHNSYEESAFGDTISEIGYDWKKLNESFSYDIIDTVVYYLKTYAEGDSTYYKLYFTDFTGMSEGKYTFMQEEIWILSAEDPEAPGLQLQVYPNPASDHIQVVFDLYGRTDIEIIDMTGRLIHATAYEARGFTSLSLDLEELNPGVFFVKVSSGDQSDVHRFIKK